MDRREDRFGRRGQEDLDLMRPGEAALRPPIAVERARPADASAHMLEPDRSS
jgi:hypothetical protein